MIKKTLSISLIGFFLGILIPISVQAIDGSYDIYGEVSDITIVQSIDEPVQVYQFLSNSTKTQTIEGTFGVYEDWTSPTIRSDRWIGRTDQAYETRLEVLGHHLLMRYRLEGLTGSNTGFRGAMHRIVALSPVIDEIEANFQIKSYTIIGCEANQLPTGTRVRPVMISLWKFNDGTSSSPGDMTGDHFVRVIVNREAFTTDPEGVLTVQAFLFRCIDATCSNAISNVFNLDFGKIRVGKPFSLRAMWEKNNYRFLVGFNSNPDIVLAYDPALDKGPARNSYAADIRQQLVNATCIAGPTVTDAEIKVREIYTNVSAIIP